MSRRSTGGAYDTVRVSGFDRAIETHRPIKGLLAFGEGFEGQDLAAIWDDTLAEAPR